MLKTYTRVELNLKLSHRQRIAGIGLRVGCRELTMSSLRSDVRERDEILLNEADDLRAENRQLYRLVLQLISDLDELEDALSAARVRPENR